MLCVGGQEIPSRFDPQKTPRNPPGPHRSQSSSSSSSSSSASPLPPLSLLLRLKTPSLIPGRDIFQLVAVCCLRGQRAQRAKKQERAGEGGRTPPREAASIIPRRSGARDAPSGGDRGAAGSRSSPFTSPGIQHRTRPEPDWIFTSRWDISRFLPELRIGFLLAKQCV